MKEEVPVQVNEVLEPAGVSARLARAMVRKVLQEGRRPEWLEAAELAVGELVTNAVLHAHTPVGVSIALTRSELRVEVRDDSPIMPSAREWGREASTGRGIALVACLTSEYGVRRVGSGGKVVWFCIRDEDRPAAAGTGAEAPRVDGLSARDGQEVVLCGFPPALWLAAREHHDALLRDFGFYRANRPQAVVSTADDVACADRARLTISAALDEAVAEEGSLPARLDLTIRVPFDRRGDFARLQDVLDEAERLAAGGELLVRPALPEVVGLRDWACDQVVDQARGGTPSSWTGTASPRFTECAVGVRAAGWDLAALAGGGRPIIVADDANRIITISPVLADALGWSASALAGRRLVALIPARLREAHVAGFTRYLATGRKKLLGTTAEVAVLRADGSEVAARLRLDEHPAPGDRTVFVAQIDLLGRE